MKVKVTDLGVIKEAEIDLTKRLTIFCGPNNTGKTYLSYVLYALNKNIFYKGIKFGDFPKATLSEPSIVELDIEKILKVIDYTYKSVIDNFDTIFGVSEAQVKTIFNKTCLTPIFDRIEIEKQILMLDRVAEISIGENKIRFSKEANSMSVKTELLEGSRGAETSDIPDLILFSALYKLVSFYNFKGTFISPVERNSIYTFSKELSISRNNLIDSLQKGGDFDPFDLIFNNTNRYPLAITDGLKVSNDLANLQKTTAKFATIAEAIETELLNGKLSVTDKGELLFAPDTVAKFKKIPLHMTASIVKTLSSLVFYLKHIAEEGDLIIIDEPEMNLHPDNQIVLVRILARLINCNFRLLISTHSDYIIREFNNLMMINELRGDMNKELNELGYSVEDKINYKDVNCYFFKFRKTKTRSVIVEKLKIGSQGVTVPTIDETIDSQNKIYEELLYLNSSNNG